MTLSDQARRPPSLATCLSLGVLLGASFGVVEMAVRIAGRMEPSVARRVPELLGYAALVYGLVGLIAGAHARLSARGPHARTAPLAVTLGAVVFVVLILHGGSEFWERSSGVRLATFAVALGRAEAIVLLVRRLVPGRWIPRFVAPATLTGLGLVTLAIATTWALVSARGEADEPFAGERGTASPDAPHIVFVLVDTLRADVLGSYGDPGGLSPHSDALAARGAVFEDVLAPTSWTLPSIASLFTSREPWRHGVVDFPNQLPSDLDSLPKALGRAGYDRRAFVGNGLVSFARGFSQGFEHYDVYNFDLESHLFLTKAFTRVLRLTDTLGFAGRKMNPVPWLDRERFPWLTTRISFDADDMLLTERVLDSVRDRGDDPLFLYVHYGAPHSPYTEHPQGLLASQPELAPEHRDELWERYRAETQWTDAALGRLLEGLDEEGILENALVVFTADHGEEFLDHGKWEHGYSLYEEVVRVPWILAGPGVAPGTRLPGRARLIDVAPTLLSLAGVEPIEEFDGTDHAPALRSGVAPNEAPRPVFCELTTRFLNPGEDYFSAHLGRWKVVRRRDVEGNLLAQDVFDLEADSLEQAPLVAVPEELDELLAALDAYESLQAGGELTELTPEQLETMRALGYMDQVDKGD